MSSARMKVKVRVVDLIAKVEVAKAQAIADHEQAVKKYNVEKALYRSHVCLALRAALKAAQEGTMPEYYGYRGGVVIKLEDEEPSEPTLNTRRFDKDLGILQACVDEILMVSADSEFGLYL